MAIAFDAASGAQAQVTTPWTVTWSHTIGSGSDRLLTVGSGYDGGTGPFTTSVTYNGVALTNRVFADQGFVSTRISDLGDASMPSAGAHNIVATWAADNYVVHSAASYDGVKDQAPEASGTDVNSSGTGYSVSITTITNNALIVAHATSAEDTTHTPTSPATERHQENYATPTATQAALDRTLATAGATTIAGTWGADKRNTAAALAYEEAGGAPPSVVLGQLMMMGVGT